MGEVRECELMAEKKIVKIVQKINHVGDLLGLVCILTRRQVHSFLSILVANF